MRPPVSLPSVHRARTLVGAFPLRMGGLFDLSRVSGRVVEVSEAGAFGALSALCGLMLQVQAKGELIAWVATGDTIFFPPDLAFRGLDLGALTVIRVPEPSGFRAADELLRSGAFGLIVVDGAEKAEEAMLGRLARMAEDLSTAVLVLTKKKPGDASLGSQVSLRGAVSRGPAGVLCEVLRDKHAGPLSKQEVAFHGPSGLY